MRLFSSADYFHVHPSGKASTSPRHSETCLDLLLASWRGVLPATASDRFKPSFGGLWGPSVNPQTSTPRREKEHPKNFARETLSYTDPPNCHFYANNSPKARVLQLAKIAI